MDGLADSRKSKVKGGSHEAGEKINQTVGDDYEEEDVGENKNTTPLSLLLIGDQQQFNGPFKGQPYV